MAYQRHSERIVTFQLDDRFFGLPLDHVQRVVRAAEVTPIPNSHPWVLGLLNIQGRIVCILDMRQLLGVPPRDIELTDQFLIVHDSGREVGLLTDTVFAVREYEPGHITDGSDLIAESPFVTGVARGLNNVVFLLDAERLISMDKVGREPGAARARIDLGRWP